MKIEQYKGDKNEIIAVEDKGRYKEIEKNKQQEMQMQMQMQRSKGRDFEIEM
jgi:hypothetical protein